MEIYTHKTKENNDYGLGEIVKTEINQLSIIPILSDSIYKDPKSAFRELYANEVTSCKKSKLDTRIEVNINTHTRDLIIQGFNSMGITRDVFDKILRVMGNSGNTRGNTSGMFGLGFFSHTKLCEKMICHSYAQNGERFSFISKSGLSFEILPDDLSEKLEYFGMKIILNVKDEININELIDYIFRVVEFSPIKTNIIIDDIDVKAKQFQSLKALMKNDFEITDKKYNSISHKIHQNHTDQYDIVIVEKYPYDWHDKKKSKCYLANMPIDYKTEDIDYNAVFYVNIKNEREFLPHVSRDFFTAESEIKIKDILERELILFKNNMRNYDKINIMEYINDKERFFKYLIYGHGYSIYDSKKTRMQELFVNFFKNIPEDYHIKGVCQIKNKSLRIAKELYNLGYFCICSDSELNFDGLSDPIEVLKQNNIKTRLGIKTKRFHIYTKSKDPIYIFRVNDPKYYSQKHQTLGFVDINDTKHLDLNTEIPKILENKKFWSSKGLKNLFELQNLNVYFTNEIYDELNDNNVYITNEIEKDLIAIFYNKSIYEKNMYREYICSYNFKNKKLVDLINKSIININYIENKEDLDFILRLEIDNQ